MLSIIIPVYNAAPTIGRCVESVLRQPLSDMEVLLVDDGSTDGSGATVDGFAGTDSRIRVIHKPNGGVSSARNAALDEARGEWVMFVDADDSLLPGSLSVDDWSADWTLYSVCTEGCNNEIHDLQDADLPRPAEFISRNLDTVHLRTPWGKVYSRRLIGELRFDESMRLGEDLVFNLEYASRVSTLQTRSARLYRYFSMATSTFYRKYHLRIEQSVYNLGRFRSLLLGREIDNPEFRRTLFVMYKRLCQSDIYRRPGRWFDNPTIRTFYDEIRPLLPTGYRRRYRLTANPLINCLNSVCRSILKSDD